MLIGHLLLQFLIRTCPLLTFKLTNILVIDRVWLCDSPRPLRPLLASLAQFLTCIMCPGPSRRNRITPNIMWPVESPNLVLLALNSMLFSATIRLCLARAAVSVMTRLLSYPFRRRMSSSPDLCNVSRRCRCLSLSPVVRLLPSIRPARLWVTLSQC